jgi:hypothetical protein
MTSTSRDRIAVLSIALAATVGTPVVYGVSRMGGAPSIETRAATLAGTAPELNSKKAPSPVATASNEADAAGAAVPILDQSGDDLNFDIVRVDNTGETVVAGRAVPGAKIDLLLNGSQHDQATANETGEFIMLPPKLAPGEYVLTLRSRQPGGGQATSKRRVVILLREVASPASSAAARSLREVSVQIR